MTHLLGAEKLTLEYPTKQVFKGVTLGITAGDRIGIVGRNGDGKSSLLGLLTGNLQPDSGKVTHRSGLRFGVLSQTDELTETASVGANIVGDRPEYEWASDAQIRDIITGLVHDLDWHAPVSTLSGGQRRRVALAKLLVCDWDVLALDEPTNHLDVEGIAWLAAHLKNRWSKHQGALLVITHDRWFLDEVCNRTWEVHDGAVEPFEGGYAAYILQRLERDRIAAATEQKRQNLLRKELAWLRRGAPARTSKPKFRIAAANALIADVPPLRDTITLQKMATARLGKEVVNLTAASVSFATTDNPPQTANKYTGSAPTGANEILKEITWNIAPGERTGILGSNGAGKSTLLALIAGTLQPTSGRVKHGKTVRIGILDQRFAQLAAIKNDRVHEVLARYKTSFTVEGKELTPAQLLERLGFRNEQLATPVADLSGGQKRRLQLLLTLLAEPNMLILDEPTNDVDADMLAAMEDLLDSWPGTLLVVSHDRYLLERVTDHQYAILDGKLRHLPGGVAEYLQLQAANGSVPPQNSAPSLSTGVKSTAPVGKTAVHKVANGCPPALDSNPYTTASAQSISPPQLTGAALRTAEKELAALERRITKLEAEVQVLHEKIALHDQTDYTGLSKITAAIADLQSKINVAEERWLELGEQLRL